MGTELSTKEKILKISHKLIADKGFIGVTIREIAKESDVNIAAINYHFQNKEALYFETIRNSMSLVHTGIKDLYESLSDKSSDSFVIGVFDFFLVNADDLRTGFKLVMSSDKYQDAIDPDLDSTFNGPPGGEYFYQCLSEEYPKAKEEDLMWAVRILFTQVIHKAMVLCNKSICSSIQKKGLGPDVFREDIKRLLKLVKTEIA